MSGCHVPLNLNICFLSIASERVLHQCKECEKSYITRAGLYQHVRAFHRNPRQFTCSVCERIFHRKEVSQQSLGDNYLQQETFFERGVSREKKSKKQSRGKEIHFWFILCPPISLMVDHLGVTSKVPLNLLSLEDRGRGVKLVNYGKIET